MKSPAKLRSALKRALLAWYGRGGNGGRPARAARDLPWRRTSDPYAIWVSETMLQQTRAATVVPYWERFLRELPTVQTLAEAAESQVLALWSGLGYYRRARMLHAAARRVVALHGGGLPRDREALSSLEGVGAYTVGAIASIAFKERVAAVDGNVSRVLARIAAIEDDVTSARGKALVQAEADALAAIDEGDPGDWTQALMELGALVCAPRQPRCGSCPARAWCRAFARGGVDYASTLPRKAPKREKAVVERVAIVLHTGTAVVLARRRALTLYGGLWEVPTAPRSAKRRLAKGLGVNLTALDVAGEVVHILSHRRMHVQVLRGSVSPQCLAKCRPAEDRLADGVEAVGAEYDALDLVPYGDLPTRAHASLTRKVLDVANLHREPLF